MEGNKKYVGYPVETPDGNLGTILDYDETTNTYEVELDSGKSRRFKPSDLDLRSRVAGSSGPPGSGGSEDW